MEHVLKIEIFEDILSDKIYFKDLNSSTDISKRLHSYLFSYELTGLFYHHLLSVANMNRKKLKVKHEECVNYKLQNLLF